MSVAPTQSDESDEESESAVRPAMEARVAVAGKKPETKEAEEVGKEEDEKGPEVKLEKPVKKRRIAEAPQQKQQKQKEQGEAAPAQQGKRSAAAEHPLVQLRNAYSKVNLKECCQLASELQDTLQQFYKDKAMSSKARKLIQKMQGVALKLDTVGTLIIKCALIEKSAGVKKKKSSARSQQAKDRGTVANFVGWQKLIPLARQQLLDEGVEVKAGNNPKKGTALSPLGGGVWSSCLSGVK